MLFLDIETDPSPRRATLRLLDSDQRFLDAHEVVLAEHAPSLWAAAFDTRRHLARMHGIAAPAAQQLEALGKFLGEQVLGASLAGKLTVLVRLPDPTHDDLAAAFARVPWELARAPGLDGTLLERNMVVRAAPAGAVLRGETSVALEPGEPV